MNQEKTVGIENGSHEWIGFYTASFQKTIGHAHKPKSYSIEKLNYVILPLNYK